MAQRKLDPLAITLIIVDVILVIILIALLATRPDAGSDNPTASEPSGGASGTASAEPSTEPSQTATTPPERIEPPADARDISTFASPSGNIWCDITDEAATCTITEYSFTLPEDPTCEGGTVGPIVRLIDGDVTTPCSLEGVGDAAPGDFGALEYGETTAVGDYMCSSAESGMTCTNLTTGRGFTLARGALTEF